MSPLCGNCHLEMTCTKTGRTVAPIDNPNYVKSGDEFTCKECGNKVIVNMNESFYNPIVGEILFK